jgi:hypothetical protein
MQVAAARNAANWLCRVAQGFRSGLPPEPTPPGGRGHGPGPAVTQPGDGAGKAASERFPGATAITPERRRPGHAGPHARLRGRARHEGGPRPARRLDGGPAPLTMENPRIEKRFSRSNAGPHQLHRRFRARWLLKHRGSRHPPNARPRENDISPVLVIADDIPAANRLLRHGPAGNAAPVDAHTCITVPEMTAKPVDRRGWVRHARCANDCDATHARSGGGPRLGAL